MAFGPHGSGPLLNAMVALTSLQLAPSQHDSERGRERALRYYVAALQEHQALDPVRKGQLDDAVLATVLLFAHFEVLFFSVQAD